MVGWGQQVWSFYISRDIIVQHWWATSRYETVQSGNHNNCFCLFPELGMMVWGGGGGAKSNHNGQLMTDSVLVEWYSLHLEGDYDQLSYNWATISPLSVWLIKNSPLRQNINISSGWNWPHLVWLGLTWSGLKPKLISPEISLLCKPVISGGEEVRSRTYS